MRRSLSHTAQLVLSVGLALGSVQETATAQVLYNGYNGAKAEPNPSQTGQVSGSHKAHVVNGRRPYPEYGPVGGAGAHGGRPAFSGPFAGNPPAGGGFHEGPWRRPIGGGGFGYGGPRFGGGFPAAYGGMAGLLITAGAAAAAASAENAQQASQPPRRRRPAAAIAPAPAAPPARAIAHAPPPPARAMVHMAPAPPVPRLASTAHLPPPGETRFRPGEVLVATAPGVPRQTIEGILRRHRLAEADATTIALTGQSLRLWHFPTSRPVPGVVRELGGELVLASIQPNYIYSPQGEVVKASPPVLEEYWLTKLKVDNSLDVANGKPVRVAVIDTAIDEAHPDLKGTIEASFDAIGAAEPTRARQHGTSMAGAIAAHGWLKGVAPTVRILSARALDQDDRGLESGSTQSVVKAVQWAADQGARIINMSFDGPVEDPDLHAELAAAYAKGLVLIGAAGNDGPNASPRYPGADEHVVAVTATDADDEVFADASSGSYVAVAAPGVDVMLSAPGGYKSQSGTSVSAALVSGVAALLIERCPEATPSQVKTWLLNTAEPLGAAANSQVGAGLVDARRAVEAAARPARPTAAVAKPPGS